MNLETKLIIIFLLWSFGCVMAGVGITLVYQYYKVDVLIRRLLNLQDDIYDQELQDNNVEYQENQEKTLEEIDWLQDRIENIRIMADDGMMSHYDYEHDLRMYERRIDELEKSIRRKQED